MGWLLVHTYRLEELGINVSQPEGMNQAFGFLSIQSFPWNEDRITALSNRYMNSRTLGTTEYQCAINQVGVFFCNCNYDWACTYTIYCIVYIHCLSLPLIR